MKQQNAFRWLVSIVGLLALVASGTGLFFQGGGGPFTFTTLHGQAVEMYGQGVYAYDTLFSGAGYRGSDLVTFFVSLPLLAIAYRSYRGGSLRGGLLLISALVYLLYNAIHMAFAAAYNHLFLVYVAYFSTSFFATTVAFLSVDLRMLAARISPRLPRRGMAIFLFIAGTAPLVLWSMDVIGALLQNRVPELLGGYTTMVTYTIDLGIITPVVYLAAVLLLRRAPLGDLLAAPLLILCALIGLSVVGQTVFQLGAGIQFSPGQMVGMVGSWVILGVFAIAFTVRFLSMVSETGKQPAVKAAGRI